MPRPVHFEIHAVNPEKIVTFYAELFGWKITHLPELTYWMIETGEGDGINGGLMKRIGPKPAVDNPVNAYVCSIGIFVRRRICGACAQTRRNGCATQDDDPGRRLSGVHEGSGRKHFRPAPGGSFGEIVLSEIGRGDDYARKSLEVRTCGRGDLSGLIGLLR